MQELFSIKSLKFYFIKIIDKESIKYIDDDYWAWKNHIFNMKNQFEVNDVDEVCWTFSNLIDKKKIEYVYEFLDKALLSNWKTEKKINFYKKHTWKKYRELHKKHVFRYEYLIENMYNKYINEKQGNTQFIINFKNYLFKIHFILSIEMRDSKKFFFMTFRRKLRFEFQQKFKKQTFIIDIQTFVERVLNLKKNEKKIRKIMKIKTKREIFFFIDFFERKFKDDKIKNKNHFNFNKNFIDEKNKYTKRKYRWISKEYQKLKKNDNCLFCKKSDHRVNDCNNLKSLSNENETFNSKN